MIDRIDCIEMSNGSLLNEHAFKSPLIITGGTNNWGFHGWDLNTLDSNMGERDIVIRKSRGEEINKAYTMKMNKFIEIILNGNPNKWYCDWPFFSMGDEDLDDYYSTPECFNEVINHGISLKDRFKWFFLGSEGTGTELHQDFDQTNNWHGIVFGEKEWIFLSPESYIKLKEQNKNISATEFHENISASKYKESLRILQKPGEIIYTPKNWWHSVRNIKTTFSVSENFWFK